MNYESLIQKLPGVARPLKRLTFKEKLKWTLAGLLFYYILSEIAIWGVSSVAIAQFQALEDIMGASFGSIITLGIGPIVTSSIFLQLLTGSGIINWDLSTHHGKVMFQGTQKILTYVLCFVEAAAYTLMGAIQPMNFLPMTVGLVIFQIALGGIIIVFLDEVISKWGFGSGVSLFIAAGVSKQIFVRLFNPLGDAGSPSGVIPHFISSLLSGMPDFMSLVPVATTLFIFGLVVYAQAMRVEIPLAFGSIRGFGRKWPLKFIYTSVIPVILAAALFINFKVWGQLLASRGFPILGTFSADGAPLTGLVHYLNPPTNFIWNLLTFNIVFDEVLRVIIYTSFFVGASVIFSIFWMHSANMDSHAVAKQIQNSGMQIPGFRRDIRVVERVLDRYIPGLAVLGGAFVGLLAAFADFTGALAGGTGILLAVMIIYQLYEQISTQHMEDMYPSLRKFMGKV
ncbi:MAG: preprotein translocase subunit SecY [archaeon]|nr:preprotein translocase subunit SecY [archaeon]